jgi:putative endonuclease
VPKQSLLPPVFARHDSAEAISVRNNGDCRASLAMTPPFVFARHDSAEAISGTIGVVRKQYYVYIMTNRRNTVLYIGVTNDLIRRVYEHKEKLADGFTRKYNIVKLVYYEVFEDIENAILREKQIKAGSRQKKVQLIHSINREWHDLYDEL